MAIALPSLSCKSQKDLRVHQTEDIEASLQDNLCQESFLSEDGAKKRRPQGSGEAVPQSLPQNLQHQTCVHEKVHFVATNCVQDSFEAWTPMALD